MVKVWYNSSNTLGELLTFFPDLQVAPKIYKIGKLVRDVILEICHAFRSNLGSSFSLVSFSFFILWSERERYVTP